MDEKLSKIYYSPQGYWKGYTAINHLAEAANVSKEKAKAWLEKQAMWQIFLPAPKHIPRPRFDVRTPNEVHQADLLFLPHDRPGRGRKLYKYALTLVDIASRYKEAEALASKTAKEVAVALEKIYKRSPLTYPKLFQCDPGKEFMGEVTKLLENHGTKIRRGRVDIHRDQAIVERFNQTLAERLFGHQYAQEMLLDDDKRSVEWVKRLPEVVKAINSEVTRIIANKPEEAIKLDKVAQKPPKYDRPVGLNEERLSSNVGLRYLYYDGELEGGSKRVTDPIWSLEVYTIEKSIIKPHEPVLYYLYDAPTTRGFVREELLVVAPDTQLPPNNIL